MAFLLLPSKHWLIALVPLSVAGASLVWQGQESKSAISPRSTVQLSAVGVGSQNKSVSENPVNQPIPFRPNPISPWVHPVETVENTDWQDMHGKITESIKKLDEELKRRQLYIREMQKHIETSIKRIELEKRRSSAQLGVQQLTENIDFTEIGLINHMESLLDSNKAELKRLVRTEARNMEQTKVQLRSYREMLCEMKKMAYKKTGRFNIDID